MNLEDYLNPFKEQEDISPLRPEDMPTEEEWAVQEEEKKAKAKTRYFDQYLKPNLGQEIDQETELPKDALLPQIEGTPQDASAFSQVNEKEDINKKLEDFKKIDLPGYPEKNIYPDYEVPKNIPSTQLDLSLKEPTKFKPDVDKIKSLVDEYYGSMEEPEKPSIYSPKEMEPPSKDVLSLLAASARDLSDIFGNRTYQGWTNQYNEKQDKKKDDFQSKKAAIAAKAEEINSARLKTYYDRYQGKRNFDKDKFMAFKDMMNLGLDAHKDFETKRGTFDENQIKRFAEQRQGFGELMKSSGQFTDQQIKAWDTLSGSYNDNQKNRIDLHAKMQEAKNALGDGNLAKFKEVMNLKQQLETSQEWKDHEKRGQGAQRFIRAKLDSAGDLDRIYAYIHNLDPNAVREGEIDNVRSAVAWMGSPKGDSFFGNFGTDATVQRARDFLTGKALLNDDVRGSMFNSILNAYNGSRSSVLDKTTNLQKSLNRMGLNEGSVIAPRDYLDGWVAIDKFQKNLAKIIEKNRRIKDMKR
jgi:hypothetical protein